MIGWWNGLTDLQRIFALVGIPATLVLVVQTILLLFGLGAGHEDGCDCGCDLDGDGIPDDLEGGSDDGLTLFSVRGIVAMFCIAGWSGIVFIDFGMGQVEAILLAVLCGVAALFGMAYLMKSVLKLAIERKPSARSRRREDRTGLHPDPAEGRRARKDKHNRAGQIHRGRRHNGVGGHTEDRRDRPCHIDRRKRPRHGRTCSEIILF